MNRRRLLLTLAALPAALVAVPAGSPSLLCQLRIRWELWKFNRAMRWLNSPEGLPRTVALCNELVILLRRPVVAA